MYNNFNKDLSSQKPRKLFNRRSKIKAIALIFALSGLGIAAYVMRSVVINTPQTAITFAYSPRNNTFSNFFYQTTDSSGRKVEVRADKVVEESKESFAFEKVTANFMLPNEENGTITSDKGKMVRKEKPICEFFGNVVMSTRKGLFMKTEQSFFDSATSILHGKTPITIIKDDVNLSANEYSFDTEKNLLTLINNAKAKTNNQNVSANKIILAFDGNNKDSVKSFSAQGNAAIISDRYNLSASDDIQYDSSTSKINANKNVVLVYKKSNKGGSFTVQSNQMNAVLNEQSEITEAFANGHVIIKTQNSIIKADRGIYDNKKRKIITSGNVMIAKDQGNIFGEMAELDLDTENISMTKSSGIVFNNEKKE